ncbi:FAD-dependent oxidoreductase, partial [Leucobacter sp. M11]|uniref:FAD-dependent oxidoreductase n=1 Tax=Leucobacter sp. M11 TaxID=2993565 RepID=UPI002D7FD135
MTQTQHRVTVIGAGILGAAAAVELASRGHRVAVLDDPAGSPAASDAAFGWLTRAGSAAAGPGREIPELASALRDTRALLARLDRAPEVAWCGAASWAETPEQTRAFVAGSGGDAELLDPAGRARALPGLRLAPEAIAWAPNEAALDAWATRRALLGHAVRSGAVLRNDRVTGIEALPGGGFRATTASGEQLDSERIVLACGVGIP